MNFGDPDSEITGDELNAPTKRSSMPTLPLLPDREWVKAVITEVKYCRAEFNGKIRYLTRMVDGVQEDIVDPKTGQKIELREYKITYTLIEHFMPNSTKMRKSWVNLGASLGKKSKLRGYLISLGISAKSIDDVPDEKLPTPAQIIKLLQDLHVFIQFAMVPAEKQGEEPQQKLVKDAIKRSATRFIIPDIHETPSQSEFTPPAPQKEVQTIKKEETTDISNVFGDFAKPQPVSAPAAQAPVPGWDD